MQIPQIFINIKSYSLIVHKPDSRGRKSDINLSYCWSLMHGILPYFVKSLFSSNCHLGTFTRFVSPLGGGSSLICYEALRKKHKGGGLGLRRDLSFAVT